MRILSRQIERSRKDRRWRYNKKVTGTGRLYEYDKELREFFDGTIGPSVEKQARDWWDWVSKPVRELASIMDADLDDLEQGLEITASKLESWRKRIEMKTLIDEYLARYFGIA